MKKLLQTQKYAECQLVAVINAAAYLGQPLVDPASEEYERLVDLTAARHGSAIWPHKAVEYLRLVKKDIDPIEVDAIRAKVLEEKPVQIAIQHPTAGHHAILLTNGNHRGAQVWNAKRPAFPHDRLSWNRIRELISALAPQCRRAMWYELDPMKVKNGK